MIDLINLILIGFGGIVFLLGVFALFKILTSARKTMLEKVGGDFFAYLSMIAFVLLVIGGSVFWIFSSVDFEASRSFKRYIHSFTETYFLEGGLCLLITYGVSKIKPDKHGHLSEGKKIFVIVAGTALGLLAIFLGLKKIFGD